MEGSGHVEVANDVGSKHEDIEEAKESCNEATSERSASQSVYDKKDQLLTPSAATPTFSCRVSLPCNLTPLDAKVSTAATPILSPPAEFKENETKDVSSLNPLNSSTECHQDQQSYLELMATGGSALALSSSQKSLYRQTPTPPNCMTQSIAMSQGLQESNVTILSSTSLSESPDADTRREFRPCGGLTEGFTQQCGSPAVLEDCRQSSSNSAIQEDCKPCGSCTVQQDYKTLYHRAVEKIQLQAEELEGYRSLMSSVCKLATLKDKYLDCVRTASHEIHLFQQASQKKLDDWAVERSLARNKCERTVAALVVESAVNQAKCTLLEEEVASKENILYDTMERLSLSEVQLKSAKSHLHSLQSKLQNERDQLQFVTFENEELMEFAECEKKVLEDTVQELHHQVKAFACENSSLSEEVEKVKFLLKRESTKSMRYQIFSEGVVGQLQKMRWDESTKENHSLEMSSNFVHKMLAQWKAISTHGFDSLPPDVKGEVEEKVLMEDKILDLNEKLRVGAAEYARLKKAFKDYQSKANDKISVLKSNLEKADLEISELDDLVDRVVSVMKDNYSSLKVCPPLLKMLEDLTGPAIQ